MGLQPAHQHRGSVRAPAGGLGGGEDGSLPPDPGAGTCSSPVQQGALLRAFNAPFLLSLKGLNFLIPILDRIRYVQSLKEIVIDVPEQSAVSLGLYQPAERQQVLVEDRKPRKALCFNR